MVIIFHWSPASYHFLFPIGSWGVELFFVLSGFLITKILLESRRNAEVNHLGKMQVIKNFLLRRSLRIFPLYYLALFIILIFDRTNISGLKDHLAYFFGYASNFYFFKVQNFNYPMAHFWSLAVEEQFYLVWPFMILFLPEKLIKPFLIFSIFLAILSRFILSKVLFFHGVSVDVLTPACIDCFAVGGLFSYLTLSKKNLNKTYSLLNVVGISSLILVFIIIITKNHYFSFLSRTLDSFFCLTLIANAYRGFKGIAGKIAGNSVIIYLGKISYGLYIYHLLTPWLTMIFLNIVSRIKNTAIQNLSDSYYNAGFYTKFTIDLAVLIAVASFSWFFIEKQINKYKYLFSDKKLRSSTKVLYSAAAS